MVTSRGEGVGNSSKTDQLSRGGDVNKNHPSKIHIKLDYLFFPKVKNRQELFDRIKKSFEKLSDELGMFVKEGQNRPIYVYRHSFISGRRKRSVDANVVALNSNSGVPMIN